MIEENDGKASPLPGLRTTLSAGFELVTAHWWLVLLPVLLDAFLWLGPRLGSQSLLLETASLLKQEEALTQMATLMTEVAGETNLFSSLSIPLFGVPVLMASFVTPVQTPVRPVVFELSDPLSWAISFVMLSLVGLLLATVYYGSIAAAIRAGAHGRVSLQRLLGWLPIYALRLLLLALIFILAGLAIYLPLIVMAAVVALLSPALASIVLAMGVGLFLWLLFYLSFSLHGILLNNRPVFAALLESLRLVQAYSGPALTLLLAIIVSRNLLSWLWLWADTGNWLTFVSIVGHAFVMTALVAATFVFYQDRVQKIG